MAPKDVAKNVQAHRPRPGVRGIVPAIPLPYMQMQKRAQAQSQALAQSQAQASAFKTDETASPSMPLQSTESATNSTNIPNGEEVASLSSTPENSAPAMHQAPSAVEEAQGGKSTTDAQDLSAIDEQVTEVVPVTGVEEGTVTLPAQEEPVCTTPPAASSDNNSSASRSTYNMPPPFVPAKPTQTSRPIIDVVKHPRHLSFTGNHHPHPSVGSMMFGAYPDSNNSSPAPPPSTGGMAQFQPTAPENVRGPLMPFTNGHNGHLQNQMGPPGFQRGPEHYMVQNFGNESYQRKPQVAFGHPDAYPYSPGQGPESQRFPPQDPLTPHSFHGSQSSYQNEQENISYANAFPVSSAVNGSNGHMDDSRNQHQYRPKPRNNSHAASLHKGHYTQMSMSQPPLMSPVDDLDGLTGYLEQQFGNPEFADYVLELRYTDDRAKPVQIHGHSLLFARSPVLKKLINGYSPITDGFAPRTIHIQSENRFLRSDAFWLAAHRLYGAPLLDPGASAGVMPQPGSHISPAATGTPADRFDLALGYAAAGYILEIPPVLNRGIGIASHFVSWLTLEKALDFALDGGLDSSWMEHGQHSTSQSTYGPIANSLVHSALTFIVNTFPPNFELDTTVTDPKSNARLPFVSDTRQAAPNHRLSTIRFGDHEDEAPRPPNNSNGAILSRVLINLPFQLLKYVLEYSPLGNVQGWATVALREKVMHAVVAEREKRRDKVRENKNVPTAERQANARVWEVVGWRESLAPPHAPSESSSIVRSWEDFSLLANT